MQHYADSNTRLTRAIIYTLLVHGLILILFFLLQLEPLQIQKLPLALPQEQRDDVMITFEEEPQKTTPWAATEARRSLFDKNPDFEAQNNALREPATNKTTHEELSDATDLQPEPQQEHTQQKSESQQHQLEQLEKIVSSIAAPAQQTEKVVQPKKMHPQKKNNPPLTLAHIGRSYLDETKRNGTHAITMLGVKNAQPTDEQMKHERYLQRIGWCLQNSFKHQVGKIRHLGTIRTSAQVALSLYNDGRIADIRVTQYSGIVQLDSFIINIFQDASSSFPPVPTYLPRNPYTILYSVEIDLAHTQPYRIQRY